MDGEGSKSRDEIWIAKWVVGGCDSIYAYFMVSILLDFAPPQLDFAAGSYAMEGADRAGVAPWRRADGAGVMRRGGEAGCCAHHRQGCAMEAADGAEEGDETGSCRLLCRVGSVKARASMRWRWAGWAKLQPM